MELSTREALAERLNRLATYLRAPGSRLGDRSAQDNWYEAGMCEAAATLLREPLDREAHRGCASFYPGDPEEPCGLCGFPFIDHSCLARLNEGRDSK